jgi:hypothetical protein
MSVEQITLLPIFLEVDGVPVVLIELSKQETAWGETYYIASVKVIYKGIASRVFPLYVKDSKDLLNKLKVEITKIKFIDHMYGLEEVRRIIS